jgi:class 3 adenylate cyclase
VDDGRIRYAKNGSARIAYRVFGDGNINVVWAQGWATNVTWYDEPGNLYATAMRMFSSQGRVLVFDRRGTGLSDPVTGMLTPKERAEDMLAILDAAEFERPTLVTTADAGPTSVQFAVAHPHRIQSLVLYASAARFSRQLPDFPWGYSLEEIADIYANIETSWGEGLFGDRLFGATFDLPGVREMLGRLQRVTGGPSSVRLQWEEAMNVDIRDLLGEVTVPTLVMARPGDRMVPFEASAALAAGIPGAQFSALPPGDHVPFDISDMMMAAIFAFSGVAPTAALNERVLKTILFTDIVGSTEFLSAHGDAQWRNRLDIHDNVVDELLAKYGGERAKHTGDGVFALFDGPSNAVRCALGLVGALATRGIPIRAGIHVGECERRGEEWSGMAVHVGARVSALAGAGQVLASRTVRDLCVGSELTFEDIGPHQLKGVPEDASIYLAKNSH